MKLSNAPSSARSAARRAAPRRKAAPVLLLLAVVVWGIVLLRQHRIAPVQAHIDAGIALAQQGRGIKAEREWRAAARLDPNNAEVWELLGEYYLSGQSYAQALDAYRHLVRLKPDAPEIYNRLGLCAFRSGEMDAAYRYAQTQLKRAPNDTDALALAATVLGDRGEEQQRLDYLRRLVKLTPDDHDYLLLLARTLAFKPAYGEALPVLDHALALEPDSSEALALRGLCRMNSDPLPGGQAAAEADLQRAIRINPQISSPRLNLGTLYRRQGKSAQALAQLQAAARISPEVAGIYFELAAAYDQAGQPQKATEARKRFDTLRRQADLEFRLRQRSAIDPNNFDLKLRLGQIYLQKGDLPKAAYFLNGAQALRPEDAGAKTALEALRQRFQTSGMPMTGAGSTKAVLRVDPSAFDHP
jgi:Flp pilus assembly protein TadD